MLQEYEKLSWGRNLKEIEDIIWPDACIIDFTVSFLLPVNLSISPFIFGFTLLYSLFTFSFQMSYFCYWYCLYRNLDGKLADAEIK